MKSGGIKFPYFFKKNGRMGRIKKWGNDKFGTYFIFAEKKYRNSFGSFDAAFQYLEREFAKLDNDRANSTALYPLNHDLKAQELRTVRASSLVDEVGYRVIDDVALE